MKKYVSFQNGDHERVVIFGMNLAHVVVGGGLLQSPYVDRLLGAGFINEKGDAYGYSDSLEIESREKEDTLLIREVFS